MEVNESPSSFLQTGFKLEPRFHEKPFHSPLDFLRTFKTYRLLFLNLTVVALCVFQIVKVWSEDGAGKVVEIPADMTARDVCQLLVYKSHCVDDSAWTLVEHHPILGLGKGCSQTGVAAPAFDGSGAKFQPKSVLPTGLFLIFPLNVYEL